MSANNPLVTVVIPSYNHSAFVQASIRSVIAQDYDNIELIVIDDGSRDDSVAQITALIPECEHRFVRFEFRHRPNQGLCATLNEALAWAQGEYFSTFASDDIMLPERTSFLVQKILETQKPAVFGSVSVLGSAMFKKRREDSVFEHTFANLSAHVFNPAAPVGLINLALLRDLGGYPAHLALEDLYLWLKLTENGATLLSFPQILAQYRIHGTNTNTRIKFMAQERLKVIAEFKYRADYPAMLQATHFYNAQQSAVEEGWYALTELWRAKIFNKKAVVIVAKCLTPLFVFKLWRKVNLALHGG